MRTRATVAAVCTLAWLAACSDDSDRVSGDLETDQDAGHSIDAAKEEGSKFDAGEDARPDDGGVPIALPLECKADPCFERVAGDGSSAICALTTTGTVWCWGSDGRPDIGGFPEPKGTLGRGAPVIDPILAATPMPIPSFDSIAEVSIGRDDVSCAVHKDGGVWCWGAKPAYGFPSTPKKIEGLDAADHVVVDVFVGCALLRADRSAWCWGPPGQPPLPEGSDGRPARVPRVTRPVRQIGLAGGRGNGGITAVLLLMEDRSIVTWGSAPGRPSSLRGGVDGTPAEIDGIAAGRWVGAMRLLTTDGAYAWGADNADLVAHRIPQLDGARTVELGERIAVDAKGDVYAWGSNAWGELGAAPNAIAYAVSPVPVALPAKARSVAYAVGGAFCASLVDGTIACWGRNHEGQLGRRTRDALPHPVAERIAP